MRDWLKSVFGLTQNRILGFKSNTVSLLIHEDKKKTPITLASFFVSFITVPICMNYTAKT